jgi:hypothetical protein
MWHDRLLKSLKGKETPRYKNVILPHISFFIVVR